MAQNILDACLSSVHGIIINIETPEGEDVNTPALRAKQILYRFRQELPNPEYKSIQIRQSPDNPNNSLWLIKNPESIPEEAINITVDNLDTGED